MELEFVTLTEDVTALEKLPAEQGLTGGCGGWMYTCITSCIPTQTCAYDSCTAQYTYMME